MIRDWMTKIKFGLIRAYSHPYPPPSLFESALPNNVHSPYHHSGTLTKRRFSKQKHDLTYPEQMEATATQEQGSTDPSPTKVISAMRNSPDKIPDGETESETAIATPGLSSSGSTLTLGREEATDSTDKPQKDEDLNSAGPATEGIAEEGGSEETEENAKIKLGWPSRRPFYNVLDKRGLEDELSEKNSVYWSDLTLVQKMAWRKAFLREYLAESRKTLPYIKKFFLMIYRISPWRAILLFAMNVVKGLLPAVILQTRGNFILMVSAQNIH